MKRLAPAILAAWAALIVPAHADGDPAKGHQVFKQCAFCHAIGPHARLMVGPPLNGVVGRVWGNWPRYSYSPGLVAGHKAGKVWDDAALDRWLTAPQKMVPGTKMALDGLDDPQQRADVIAYLKQFDERGAKVTGTDGEAPPSGRVDPSNPRPALDRTRGDAAALR